MKYHLLIALLFLSFSLFAQEKGASPLKTQNSELKTSVTRAVVVGISDYQHNAIPDLHFAHRDAEAFAAWLRSPEGGSVAEDNITLLTDKRATVAAVGTALFSMIDNCPAGSRFIFYFSGHGDVETKTRNQPGYLLCHDSPANMYLVGALNLRDLQDIVSTLSENEVKVILITDACHAGKLAGTTIGGPEVTASALSKQVANEVKILSCQPNELSLESEQWGGGRGVFSYNLLEGLTGLSDRDGNGVVNLLEITRYLQDVVPAATNPHSQIPLSVGDMQTALNTVDPSALSALQTAKAGALASISQVGAKGLEEDVLAKADSQTRQLYLDFKKLLADRIFFEPRNACADDLYRRLIDLADLRALCGLMTRNYAVALLDEIQQAINALLDNDPYEANNWQYHPEKYSRYPEYLQRSIELLGENHYLYRSLMSKKRYFEGYNLAKTLAALEQQPARRDSLREAAKSLYLEGIEFEPEAAYLYFAVGDLYFSYNPYQTDSLVLWCSRAAERSPGWVTPLLRISQEHLHSQSDPLTAEIWLDRALQILPNSYNNLEKLAFLRFIQNRREDAFSVAQKMIAQKPELFNAYTILVFVSYFMDGDYPATEQYAQKSVALNPSPDNWGVNFWAGCYAYLHPGPGAVEWIERSLEGSTAAQRGYRAAFLVEALGLNGRYAEAEKRARQFLAENLPSYTQAYILHMLGKVYLGPLRFPEAAECFQQSLAADPTPNPVFIADYAWLGEIARLQGKNSAAEEFFKKALAYEAGFGEVGDMKEEAWYLYGSFLLRQNRLQEATVAFQNALELRRKGFWGEYGFALLAARKGDKTGSLDWLERALDNWYADADSIFKEPLFKKIRKTKRFKALMKQYFPDGSDRPKVGALTRKYMPELFGG